MDRAGAAAGPAGLGQPVAERLVDGGERRGRRGRGPRRDRPAAFVAGPALQFADAEVAALARLVHGGDRRVVRRLDRRRASSTSSAGRELVHLACHGAFRTDNPLFSTLALGDGPLTVYDLERAPAMPEVVVLSACSVGTSAAINGGTLLGLSSALGAFGASDVIAPLTPVNDEQVLAVMRRVHDRPGGRRRARPRRWPARSTSTARLDPVAAAFVVIGA